MTWCRHIHRYSYIIRPGLMWSLIIIEWKLKKHWVEGTSLAPAWVSAVMNFYIASWALRVELRRRWLPGVELRLLGVELLSLGEESVVSAGLLLATALAAVKEPLDFITLAWEFLMEECFLFEDGLLMPPAINDPPHTRHSTICETQYHA